MKFSDTYQIKLSKIPLINLRETFDNHYKYVTSDSIKLSLDKPLLHFETDFGLSWDRPVNSFISYLLLTSIHGLESYLCGAVFSKTLNKEAHSPWTLGGRTAIDNYFHRLPSLIDKSLSLKVSNNSLWDANKRFYNEIRNPLSHGYEIDDDVDLHCFINLFEHMKSLYSWIDDWFDIDSDLSSVGGIVGFMSKR